jgi:hypothetical protein
MGIETLLLPGGVAIAVVLFWIALYKGVFSRSPSPMTQPVAEVHEAVVAMENVASESAPAPIQTSDTAAAPPPPTQMAISSAIATAPIAEAPAPFEEPQTAFTDPSISSTAMPTDTTAVTNIASPVESVGPALVIARPKRTRRAAKRLPATGTPRRRRSVQPKTEITAPESIAPTAPESLTPTGQQIEGNQ